MSEKCVLCSLGNNCAYILGCDKPIECPGGQDIAVIIEDKFGTEHEIMAAPRVSYKVNFGIPPGQQRRVCGGIYVMVHPCDVLAKVKAIYPCNDLKLKLVIREPNGTRIAEQVFIGVSLQNESANIGADDLVCEKVIAWEACDEVPMHYLSHGEENR